MKSNAEILLLALALGACSGGGGGLDDQGGPAALPPPPVMGDGGPRGSSQPQPGEARYDEVGYASWYGDEMGGGTMAGGERFDPDAMVAAHRTLPIGAFVEVTALDTGRTILVRVADRGPALPDRLVDLSKGAMTALGGVQGGVIAVRVRRVAASPQDQAALMAGQAASERIDAPKGLLVALRKKLPAAPRGIGTRPPRAATGTTYPVPGRKPPAPVAGAQTGWFVQVGAFASRERAQALADEVGGFVAPAGRVNRVQIGPFPDAAAAGRARSKAAEMGFSDARVFQQ